jgi:hypothetical protein
LFGQNYTKRRKTATHGCKAKKARLGVLHMPRCGFAHLALAAAPVQWIKSSEVAMETKMWFETLLYVACVANGLGLVVLSNAINRIARAQYNLEVEMYAIRSGRAR